MPIDRRALCEFIARNPWVAFVRPPCACSVADTITVDVGTCIPVDGADIDGNGEVGVDDVLYVLAAYGAVHDNGEGLTGNADLNGDGVVNVDDFLGVLAVYGRPAEIYPCAIRLLPTDYILKPIVTQVTNDTVGTTYRVSVELQEPAANIYSIFGSTRSPMRLPPAYQVAAPFGVNVGGVNPAFFAIISDAAYDSWLTVGITDGDSAGSLASIGIDFDAWTATNGVTIEDGAVFWFDPDEGPAAGSRIVIAQITVLDGDSFSFSCGMQGRSMDGSDWKVENVVFNDTMAV